jgi:hypothetical protein
MSEKANVLGRRKVRMAALSRTAAAGVRAIRKAAQAKRQHKPGRLGPVAVTGETAVYPRSDLGLAVPSEVVSALV